jgi:hypothetical protein
MRLSLNLVATQDPAPQMPESRSPGLFVQALAVIAVLALAVGAVWLIVRGIEESPGLVGTFVTAGSAVVAVSLPRVYEQRRERQQQHRERMAPMYEELITRMREFPSEEPENKAREFWVGLHVNLITWAPASVIKAWIAWSRSPTFKDPDNPTSEELRVQFLATERVLRAIRAELGLKDSALGVGDLQRLYINDLDDVLGPFRDS